MDAHGLTVVGALFLSPVLMWGTVVLLRVGTYWKVHAEQGPSQEVVRQKEQFRDDAWQAAQQRLMRMEREGAEVSDWERRFEKETGWPVRYWTLVASTSTGRCASTTATRTRHV